MFMHPETTFDTARRIAPVHPGTAAADAAPKAGFLPGLRVETPTGWRRAELAEPGWRVATFDGGYATVTAVERRATATPVTLALRVPGGALGNCADTDLMPGQQVLLSSQVAEEVLGQPDVLVPAAALAGFFGVRSVPVMARVVTVLDFADDEIVFANTGLALRCGRQAHADMGYIPALDLVRARAMLGLMASGAPSFRGALMPAA